MVLQTGSLKYRKPSPSPTPPQPPSQPPPTPSPTPSPTPPQPLPNPLPGLPHPSPTPSLTLLPKPPPAKLQKPRLKNPVNVFWMRKPLAFWDACSKRCVSIMRCGLSTQGTLLKILRRANFGTGRKFGTDVAERYGERSEVLVF